jgi:serine protease inhibitor
MLEEDRMRALVAALLPPLLAALPGCDRPADRGERPPPLTELPRALSLGEQAVIAGSNRFALDLLHGVVAEDTGANVFLSPLSASMALGMTMGGARGDTFEGMRAVLGFGSLHRDEINSSYRTLNDPVHGSGGRST